MSEQAREKELHYISLLERRIASLEASLAKDGNSDGEIISRPVSPGPSKDSRGNTFNGGAELKGEEAADIKVPSSTYFAGPGRVFLTGCRIRLSTNLHVSDI